MRQILISIDFTVDLVAMAGIVSPCHSQIEGRQAGEIVEKFGIISTLIL